MFRKILPAICLLGGTTAIAQPTLTADNVGPVINDKFISVVCDTTSVLPGSAGASITWNFAGLMPSLVLTPNQDTGIVVAATTATGYSSLLTAAGLWGSSAAFSASTYATATPSNTATTFYQATSAKISQTGVYISAGNNAVYTDPLDQLHFPFTYNSTFNDTYAGGIVYTPPVGGPVTASENGSATITGDAYGTLILPGTPAVTYNNVLRVHSTQNFRDSANLFGPVVANYTLETYTWYMAGYHAPLLTIATAVGPGVNTKTVSYASKQLENHEAVPNAPTLTASVEVYPNPASSYVYISYNNTTNQKVRTSIVDMTGREIAEVGNLVSNGTTNLTFNTATLAKGTYIVRIASANETVTHKLTIK